MTTALIISITIIAAHVAGRFLPRPWRKVSAPIRHLNSDPHYFTQDAPGHVHLFTEEELARARQRSLRVHRELRDLKKQSASNKQIQSKGKA